MECLSAVSKHKSWLYSLLILILMVCQTQVGCIEEERKALLEIKASVIDSYVVDVDHFLPTWVDDGNTSGDCCHWERVKCNTTTRHVTHLSLSGMMRKVPFWVVFNGCERIWPLNVSLFLHFKELKSLDLSSDCLDNKIVRTGLERLSSLKKLEILDLTNNFIKTDIFPSLSAITSLRVLHLGDNELKGYFPALVFENLELLDLNNHGYNGNQTNDMQGFERVSMLKKLKILDLGYNKFNESLMTSLTALPSLKALNLNFNNLHGPFPAQELAHHTNMEKLDFRGNSLRGTPSIQDCNKLSILKKLESIDLRGNAFDKSIIPCLSALPSVKTLDISDTPSMGGSLPIQELSSMPDLEVLLLSHDEFNGTLPMEGFASFRHLEVLDLRLNKFSGSIPSTIRSISSLRVVSFASNMLNGSLNHGLCELKNLHELDISDNMFDGSVPQCFNNLSSLKLLDISSNRFTGTLKPSPIANLTSLEYVDFGENKFEGSFPFSSFFNHTKLEVVRFVCEIDKFEVETDEPLGWIPIFQLKVLVLPSCNMNKRVVPGFLLHQRKLQVIDLSHSSLVGQFPNWLIGNNTMLKALNLRNNSFGGNISKSLYMNANMMGLDMSDNHMSGIIPSNIQKLFPNITYLNLSRNSLDGDIPSSIGDLSRLEVLDLSDNELSGEVPNGLFTNLINLDILRLSNNRLHGQVLSGNLSFGNIENLHLDSNCFTGKIGNGTSNSLWVLDISNNYFIGAIPHWMSNGPLSELVVRNNSLEGQFPCGTASFSFLDISQNYFSGSIPACLNLQKTKHLYLDSNRFTGSVPIAFRNLTDVLTLDIGNNFLSGRIPGFLGELSNLKILILRKNNFSGSIPKQLCQLRNVSLIDLSSNSLRGSIPRCLQNIIIPVYPTPIESDLGGMGLSFYNYVGVLQKDMSSTTFWVGLVEIEDEVQFTTKKLSLLYKGRNLDLMVGLDLSCNKLVGEIPEELGLLTQIHSLNLSHNQLFGPIPMQFSNLANIESLDLSSNRLSGEVPSQLIQLHYLSDFNVSHNNLSGRLPDTKGQFGTFTKESYEGNPLLCGPPLEKKCTHTSQVNDPSTNESNDKWYDIDMVSFYGSSGATWVVFLLGFGAVLYINPYWRRRWLDLVEECMYTCYYFLEDSVRKLRMFFCK